MAFCQLGHDASRSPVMAATTGTTPNPIPSPIPPAILLLKCLLLPQGCSDGAAAPLMLGVQTISGCRPLAHSTSRNGCPEKRSPFTNYRTRWTPGRDKTHKVSGGRLITCWRLMPTLKMGFQATPLDARGTHDLGLLSGRPLHEAKRFGK